MSIADELATLWRVGHRTDPLGFVPHERCSWSNRFDDPHRRFRTLYFAREQETCLREVLADLRRNTAAVTRLQQAFGRAAANDLPPPLVPAAWRHANVLSQAHLTAHGDIVDLTDARTRTRIEHQHAPVLAQHGLEQLDLHELTTRTRAVTRAIAGHAYDAGAALIRFLSSRDGGTCYAALEGRITIEPSGRPIVLTDPAPEALQRVADDWGLLLE